jgi:ornithine cyclodeaminase/alanine dehydrogenase-like protein (mu-crystallin family)
LPETLRFRPGQTVLNVSLRDIHPRTLLAAENIVDDVEHCLRAQTSPHLAEQLSGGREFVTGTLAGVMLGRCVPQPDMPVVFSPFGLGVLDIAVGAIVLNDARSDPRTVAVADFFGD